jgi:hypothetical protein
MLPQPGNDPFAARPYVFETRPDSSNKAMKVTH